VYSLHRFRLNYEAGKKSIGEAKNVPENRDQGIGLKGSVQNGIVAVFIVTNSPEGLGLGVD